MAKSLERIKARELRKRGVSVTEIARRLSVAKSTASLWVRDVILSPEQLGRLRKSSLKGAERGRLLGALTQKKRRLKLIENYRKRGLIEFKNLTQREFFVAGLALYWGEGSKKTRRVEFGNSDPKVVKFMIKWLKECFGLRTSDLTGYVGINEIHKEREQKVRQFWSKISSIPLNQFNKTSFKKVTNKKIYKNFEQHFGTMSVRVKKSAKLYYQILGLIEGLYRGGEVRS